MLGGDSSLSLGIDCILFVDLVEGGEIRIGESPLLLLNFQQIKLSFLNPEDSG